MAEYKVKVLLDEKKEPFIPFITADAIPINGSDKTVGDVVNDSYTKEEIDNKFDNLGSFQILKGRVATANDLEAIQDPHVGDVYIVGYEENNSEYVYTEMGWERYGHAGEQGPQGIPGPQGETGEQGPATYIWIKYADTPTSGMSDEAAGKKYMGVAFNKLDSEPSTNYEDYEWIDTQGEPGVEGPQGEPGVEGPTGPSGVVVSETEPTDPDVQVWINPAETTGLIPTEVVDSLEGTSNHLAPSVRAIKEDLFDLIYPIGSIYMSVNAVDPSTLFGGTWTQLKDKFLLGAGTLYESGSTGGEATHQLTVAEMPGHRHFSQVNRGSGDQEYSGNTGVANVDGVVLGTTGTDTVGGNQAHNNMPPYLAVYMWKRVS